jgi:hypothetical protein
MILTKEGGGAVGGAQEGGGANTHGPHNIAVCGTLSMTPGFSMVLDQLRKLPPEAKTCVCEGRDKLTTLCCWQQEEQELILILFEILKATAMNSRLPSTGFTPSKANGKAKKVSQPTSPTPATNL